MLFSFHFDFCLVLLCTHLVYAVDHVVHLSYSSYAGTALPNGITQWLGIPFAAPPLEALRFAPPIDPEPKAGVQAADEQGPLCISTGEGTIPDGQSEDCLYLAVFAPSSATSNSKLPVFIFIQGGGFNSDANPNLNGTGLIEASDHNIIVVTFNYRVGPWGFLASSASASGSPIANNGLRDQRKAFEWVQKYISAFGGDPDHVTIGGDSAGAASVALHLTAYGGRNDNLFHAAAAESVSFATVLTPAESQYQYDNLAQRVNCSQSDPAESLRCLRSKSAAELESENFNVPFPSQQKPPLYMFNPTLDGDIVTDLTYSAFAEGKFIKVPVIIGDDTNGGTVFTPKNTSNQAQSNSFLTTQFPYLTTMQLAEISELFPVPTAPCPDDKCWWRQVSNAYGEMRYMCPGLYISSAFANSSSKGWTDWTNRPPSSSVSKRFIGGGSNLRHRDKLRDMESDEPPFGHWGTARRAKSWAYRYNVEDPEQIEQGLGVPHTVELNAIFGPYNVPNGSAPDSYYPFESNANVVPVIQAYWTSFIRSFNPNTYKLDSSALWDEYYDKNHKPQRMLFQTAGATQMEAVDAGQRARCSYLQSIGPSIKQKV